jgi:hypothetical protein
MVIYLPTFSKNEILLRPKVNCFTGHTATGLGGPWTIATRMQSLMDFRSAS